jgi:peptidoglycan/xylan/chitin deacetylase (PgdA/CDA1 family)
MAVFRVRAVAIATGVPAVFAVLAAVLTFGSAGSPATAAETVSAAGQPASSAPWWVRRDLVRSSLAPMAVSYRMPVNDPVAFITIDDGVTKNRAGLRYVEARRLPITAFVTTWTVKDSAAYFNRITRWGSIQNHSATHASMARSSTDLEHEICYSQRALVKDFGSEPWMMRPPYGAGSDNQFVQLTAARCGISQLVMWDAVVENGRMTVQDGKLKPGAIVLLHFTPSLAKDLRAATRAIAAAGLTPANLADYLPRPT